MATQKRTFGTVLASLAVGALVVAVCAFGVFLLNGGAWSSSEPSGGAAHEVTDSVGRAVQVPDDPQSIAALDSFSGSVAVLAGAGDRLMGAPGGVISNEMLAEVYPDLGSIDQLSGNAINVETLLAADVDVVLIKRDLYDNGEETAKLDRVGIPYVVVDYDTLEGQMDAIRLVGEVCGPDAQEKAGAIADYYQQTVDLVESRAAQLDESEKVSVYHSINDPLLTDGAGSLGADWMKRAGAVSVSAQEGGKGGTGDYTATLEQVYTWNPDVVVCSTADAKNAILADEQWQGLDAVESGNVYNLPVSTSRWGQRGDPETFLGMLWLGKTLYPDLYTDIDLKQTVVAYYRDVIGLEVDDELWDAIVSGIGLRAEGSGGGAGDGSGKGGSR